jgi:D-sedoheptulose 7-phosphate isomerase
VNHAWHDYSRDLARVLDQAACTSAAGSEVGVEEGFSAWLAMTLEAARRRRACYLIGNGASASMASHFAADLAKNGGLRTQTFTDLSLLTAVANDISYDEVFAEPLRLFAEDGDMLVAISSSGRSPNILKGVAVARQRGASVVTLSAKSADNPLRGLGDLNFYLPASTYSLAETAHAAVLHHWMDSVQAAGGREPAASSATEMHASRR